MVFVGLVAIAASPAYGDSAADAQAFAARGDYLAAALKYREAYREQPRADLMCNVGVAYYKAKDLPRAHRYLDQCLGIGASLDPAFITNVRKVLTAVEQKLAGDKFKPLNLVVQPDTATIMVSGAVHDEPFVGSRRIWVPFGTYRVTVHADGHTDQVLEIVADTTQPLEQSIKLAPIAKVEPVPTDTKQRPEDKPDTTVTAPPVAITREAPPSYQRPSLLAPIVASAATGTLAGLAVGFYFSARSEAVEAGAAQDMETYEGRADAAHNRQYISWALGGVAVGGAVVAGVLWYRRYKSPSRVDVGASASANGAAISFSGRW